MSENSYLCMWKNMKNVDIDEPTSFLDHVYLGCTQREFKPNDQIIGQYKKLFESRISAGATEKLPGRDKPGAKTSGPTTWKDMLENAWNVVLRIGTQKDGATIQSFSSLFGRSPNQKRKIWKMKMNCQKFAPIPYAQSHTVKKGLSLSVYVDDIKLAGKKQH